MNEENRTILTGLLWFFMAIVLGALFISATAQEELTTAHVVLASVFLAVTMLGSVWLLRFPDSGTKSEKSKQRRVDRLLDDLSAEEVLELRQRLSDDDSGRASVRAYLDDDGELVQRR